MDFQPWENTILDLQQKLDAGELTSVALTEYCLEQIERFDQAGPRLNALTAINSEALDIARQLDEERKLSGKRSLIHGIPVVIKDNFNTYDMPTTASSQLLAHNQPSSDAVLVQLLRDSGAIILAKTNLSEFACHGWTEGTLIGQTLNPYDLTRTPGGSSGGTGSAVAADYAVAGLGTDTANSVRSPASATNLVGFRPTTGLLSAEGVIPVSRTQDSPGTLTKSVTDAAVLFDILAPRHDGFLYVDELAKGGLEGARLGLLMGNLGSDEDVLSVVHEAVARLESAGATVVEVEIEELDSNRISQECDVQLYEFKDSFNQFLKTQLDFPFESFEAMVASGGLFPPIARFMEKCAKTEFPRDDYSYQAQLNNRRRNIQITLNKMEDIKLDALIYPHQKILVEAVGKHSQAGRNGIVASILSFPSVVMPAGFSEPDDTAPRGVPIGLEFVGRPNDEAKLFRLAYAFEKLNSNNLPPILGK